MQLQRVVTPCEFAMERYRNIAMWRNLWTILLFVFGATVILFLCACIVLFLRQSWLPGAIATLGTMINGVGVSWVLSRRTDAVREEEEAYNDVQSRCSPSATPPGAAGASPAGAGGDPLAEIDRLRRKQTLFLNVR